MSTSFQASSPGGRRCITIPIIDDPESEGNEKFAVVVTVNGFIRTIEKLAIVSVEISDNDQGEILVPVRDMIILTYFMAQVLYTSILVLCSDYSILCIP